MATHQSAVVTSNGDGGLHWTSIAAIFGLIAIVLGGGWTLFNTQLGYVNSKIDTVHAALENTLEITREEQQRRLPVSEFVQFKERMLANDTEMQVRLNRVLDELRSRQAEFVQRSEHNELKARIIADIATIKDQLKVLESTRPTTGELSSATVSITATLVRLEERVRILEGRWIFPVPPIIGNPPATK